MLVTAQIWVSLSTRETLISLLFMPAKFFLPNTSLQTALDQILENTWDAFPQLAQNQIAITWITYEPPYRINTGGALSAEEFWQYQPKGASYRGVELTEPAGIATLFYMVAMHVWLEQGMVPHMPEIDRALAGMITRSSDDATSYIMDVLSGTTSGPELPSGPMATWEHQRNIVNRYFQQLGWPELRSLNLNHKTWCDRPYGREKAFLGEALENRNLLSTEATARLLHSIIGGVSVSSPRSQQMMALLKTEGTSTERIWSKSAFSERVGHYAAYVETEGSNPYLLVVFTQADRAQSEEIVAFVSDRISTFAAKTQAL